jgi:hypothetical protein
VVVFPRRVGRDLTDADAVTAAVAIPFEVHR